jgi:ribonuclease HI
MPYYAVANGNKIGIFDTWNDCYFSVYKYKNAIYKKFKTKEEADIFILDNSNNSNNSNNNNIESIKYIDYYLYTDGSCINNGKDNATAGIGIFFGINDYRNVSKKIEGKQTNNTAELLAIIETFPIIKNDILNKKNITIISDSEYAIKCATTYGEKHYNKNYISNIPNKELVKLIYETYKDISNVHFQHIKAHTNNNDIHSIGNMHADRLANQAIGLDNCPYNK